MKDKSKIPQGLYCYRIVGVNEATGGIKTHPCPYWESRLDKPKQENGYCSFLEEGDWESEGLSLLWDQVKECGINLQEGGE